MKRISYIAIFLLCSLALFWGCSKSEQSVALQSIGFNVNDLLQTKAAITSANQIKSLGLFGYSTGADDFGLFLSPMVNIFYNRLATPPAIPANMWSYTPLAYWPIDAAVKNTFFAYSPWMDGVANTELLTGYPTITYSVSQNVEDQIDLLYATPVFNLLRPADGKVGYTMKHALSWIKFYVAPEVMTSPNEKYAVTSLNMTTHYLITSATLNLGTGSWTPLTAMGTIYDLEVGGRLSPINAGNVVSATNDCLMLIPQSITKDGNMPMIHISFEFYDGTQWDEGGAFSFSIPFPDVVLAAGKVAVCVLQISTDGVPIVFWYATDNTIEEWLEDHTLDNSLVFEVY